MLAACIIIGSEILWGEHQSRKEEFVSDESQSAAVSQQSNVFEAYQVRSVLRSSEDVLCEKFKMKGLDATDLSESVERNFPSLSKVPEGPQEMITPYG